MNNSDSEYLIKPTINRVLSYIIFCIFIISFSYNYYYPNDKQILSFNNCNTLYDKMKKECEFSLFSETKEEKKYSDEYYEINNTMHKIFYYNNYTYHYLFIKINDSLNFTEKFSVIGDYKYPHSLFKTKRGMKVHSYIDNNLYHKKFNGICYYNETDNTIKYNKSCDFIDYHIVALIVSSLSLKILIFLKLLPIVAPSIIAPLI